MLPSISTRLVLISSWASLAHFISLGILGPLHSFGRPWFIPFLHSYGLFAKSFELPQPNYHIIYFKGLLAFALTPFTNSFLWALPAHLCLLSTFYDSHGLTTSFSGFPWAYLLSFGTFFLLLYKFVDYYFCHLGFMIFLTLLVLLSSPLLYCWASFYYWFLLPKWTSTYGKKGMV